MLLLLLWILELYPRHWRTAKQINQNNSIVLFELWRQSISRSTIDLFYISPAAPSMRINNLISFYEIKLIECCWWLLEYYNCKDIIIEWEQDISMFDWFFTPNNTSVMRFYLFYYTISSVIYLFYICGLSQHSLINYV